MCSRNVLSLKEKWYLKERKIELFQTTHNSPHHVPPKFPIQRNTSYGNQHVNCSKTFFETEKTQFAKLKNLLYNYYITNNTVFDFLDFIHFIIYYYSFCFRSKSLFQNHTLKKRNPNPFWYHLSFSYDYWKNDRDLWVSVLFLSLLKIIVQWKKESLKKF